MRSLLPLLFLTLFSACQQTTVESDPPAALLDSLFEQNEIFKANRLFVRIAPELSLKDSLLYGIRLDNLFNRPASGIASTTRLLQNFANELSRAERAELLDMQVRNHVKLYQYGMAAAATTGLLEGYEDQLDSTRIADLENEYILWKGLEEQAPQRVVSKEHSVIKMVGAAKVPTYFMDADTPIDLIFDTGANISLLISSLADSLGLKPLGPEIDVKGITGNSVKAGMAVAPSIRLGNVVIENAVFLIFPDSALYYPQANYQIEAIMGYPLISALEEIQLTTDGQLIIPAQSSSGRTSNLAMEHLSPLIEVFSEGDTLLLTLDTGASTTWLYQKYYELRSELIQTKYTKTEMTMAGVGAIEKHEVYLVDFNFTIGDQTSTLDSVELFAENINPEHDAHYGNLGLDAVKSFDLMTLNFAKMFIEFSNN